MLDEDAGQIEVHIEVGYTGGADEFAWLVPVPEVPVLRPSTREIFDRVDALTTPEFRLSYKTEGTCKTPPDVRSFDSATVDSDVQFETDSQGEGNRGVEVALQQSVGPYEAVTLRGDSAVAVLDWLQDHGYALSDDIGPRLEPYIATQSWFVALRMRKDANAGNLVPLGMRYPGTEPSIPLQLTGIAAVADMRLEIFVLGNARAVPENYLHLQPNPFAIDWIAAGNNYGEVVTLAANEAGGHGFATDASISTRALHRRLWTPNQYTPSVFASAQTLDGFAIAFESAGIPLNDGTVAYYAQALPFSPQAAALGWDDLGLWQCVTQPACYQTLPPTVRNAPLDGALLVDVLEEWVSVMRDTQAQFDRLSTLTRLRSSISPAEMTLDPLFVLNPDMPRVDPLRTATMVTMCRSTVLVQDAPRRFELPDGRFAFLPPVALGATWGESLGGAVVHANETIAATVRSGAPTLVVDNREGIAAALAKLNDDFAWHHRSAEGCGCASAGDWAGWLALLPIGLLLRRRD